MKIKVITRHAISNYGSLLQTLATQKVLENLGNDVEIIDYVRTDEETKNLTKLYISKSVWNNNIVKKMVYYVLRHPAELYSGKKFAIMRDKYIKMTKHCSTASEVKAETKGTDIFVTGSDQVWGAIGNDDYDPAYYLDFVNDKSKCISYAASFGKTALGDIPEQTLTGLLDNYHSISVREDSAKDIIKSLGFDNVSQVIDPTLLLNKNDWSKIIETEPTGEYVLVYQLHRNPEMNKYVEEFAKKKNLPLIRVTASPHQLARSGKTVLLPDLGGFLGYIKNAKYMITDSFHGTAFAINFGVQFINISPGLTATRNLSILNLTGLRDRMLKDYNDFNIFDNQIDYSVVDSIIDNERKKSLAWLENTLKGL